MTLPTELPKWYQVEEDQEKGWTPKTSDIIISNNPANTEIREAWYAQNNTTYTPTAAPDPLLRLQILTPIQVGGGSLPEGMILPAQIGGYPCIPGSSLRGALLNWIRQNWNRIGTTEQQFWQELIKEEREGWKPRQIRFESIGLKNLEPYPLNAQQEWQVFLENRGALSIQWQASPADPPSINPTLLNLRIITREPLNQEQKGWLKTRMKETLEQQGIGRGKNSGFGRLVERQTNWDWEIKVTGAKPGIQTKNRNDNIEGRYRWTPQVLRANLRGWFMRLALRAMSARDADQLTQQIFGGFGSPAELKLVSYRAYYREVAGGGINNEQYANIPQNIVRETWLIRAKSSDNHRETIGKLLEISQRLGGIGPGWRRPPHELRGGQLYRGSEFSVETVYRETGIRELIEGMIETIKQLARRRGIEPQNPREIPRGGMQSIWKSEDPRKWREIVHEVCASNAANRPQWCGSTNRPSGYAARQHDNYCLITTFENNMEATLRQRGFTKIELQT
jgi:hypothetical protein